MSKLFDRAVRLTLALAVAAGLGIGARSAYAGTGQQCSDNEPYISCANNAECVDACKHYYGPAATGSCFRNCCVCNA